MLSCRREKDKVIAAPEDIRSMPYSTQSSSMNSLPAAVLVATTVLTIVLFTYAQTTTGTKPSTKPAAKTAKKVTTTNTTKKAEAPAASAAVIERGQSLFSQDCAFCHGRDAGGGETGPDLTRSKLVASDVAGDKIGVVVRDGRPDKGMPAFKVSPQELTGLIAFLHEQKRKAESHPGGRRGVDVADLQTGNVEAGKKYFEGNCSSCHSPTGDLAGVATRHVGLELEKRMLYPPDAPAKVTVTLPSGEVLTGALAYLDEFTVGMKNDAGWYQSWSTSKVKYAVDAPAEAHVELLGKYTDDDVHNLMAYLQTLR
jgi:cytochrome c oxidase cbb3-type subunit III